MEKDNTFSISNIYEFRGIKGTAAELCGKLEVNKEVIYARLRKGMPVEQAFTEPLKRLNLSRKRKYIDFEGTIEEICEKYNKSFNSVCNNMKYELMDLESAMFYAAPRR